MAVGANQNRCGIITGTVDESGLSGPFDAAIDMERLREAVEGIGGISLLIIDPIVTAVTGDMHKAKFLLETQGNGPVPAKELLAHAKEGLGISHDTLRRAQKELRIVPRKLSMSGGWSWSLPSSQFLR
jgi:hypothetical protein